MGSRSNREDPIRHRVGDVDQKAKTQFNKDFAGLGKPAAPRPAPAAVKPTEPAVKYPSAFSVRRAADDLKTRGQKLDDEIEKQTR